MKSKGPSPQELRKIEKDKRRKQYEDIQVQGTNNSSIVSKRSVEMIYKSVCPPGEWFKYFVPKGKRRSPAINRGYWIRMETIRRMIFRITQAFPNQPANIINLGCGFDPLPFQLLSMGYENMTFYDIDYPDLVKNKHEMILKLPEIMDLIGQDKADETKVLNCQNYKLIGCDLKNYKLFESQLNSLVPGINIFIAEVSLAYMHFEDANRIIDLCSKVPNSHFLILEQILPDGTDESFARKMLAHFRKLRSSLKCVEQYPQKQDQVERFSQWYTQVEIKNLFETWTDLIDDDIKRQVDKIESFDEWEEFILFCQHYVVVHASNDVLVYKGVPKNITDKSNDELKMTLDSTPSLELKYPALTIINDDLYVFGGLEQTRLDATYKNGELFETTDRPCGRMCHTFNNGVVIGGRTRPGHLLNDVYKLDVNQGSWKRMKDIPFGVSRHSSVMVSEDELLIIGGQAEISPLILYNIKSETFKMIQYEGFDFSTITSFGCDYNIEENYGYIAGGQLNKQQPKFNDKLIKFWINDHKLEYEVVMESVDIERVDCKLILNNEEIFIIGGINYNQILGQNNLVAKVTNNQLSYCKIPDSIWKESPPMFIGHNVIKHNDKIRILYGGAVCYSFGSVYNYNYKIEI